MFNFSQIGSNTYCVSYFHYFQNKMEGDNAVIFNPAEQPPFFLYSLNKVLPCQDSNLKYLDPESSAIAITLQGNVINKNYAEKIRKMGKRSTDLPNECVKFNFQFLKKNSPFCPSFF